MRVLLERGGDPNKKNNVSSLPCLGTRTSLSTLPHLTWSVASRVDSLVKWFGELRTLFDCGAEGARLIRRGIRARWCVGYVLAMRVAVCKRWNSNDDASLRDCNIRCQGSTLSIKCFIDNGVYDYRDVVTGMLTSLHPEIPWYFSFIVRNLVFAMMSITPRKVTFSMQCVRQTLHHYLDRLFNRSCKLSLARRVIFGVFC